ncbi:MAG: hypothetical protein HN348_34495, partial [Proteobacteria bacterium]|nr:hypothetical protein [Pseudomonadota bacterium]
MTAGTKVSCEATPFDGLEYGSSVTTAASLNTPPTASKLELSADPVPTIDTALLCSASGADEDNDTATLDFAWITGSNLGIGTGTTLDVAALIGNNTLIEGQEVFCEVTPNDTWEDGETQFVSTTVNYRPQTSLPTLSQKPIVATNEDTLFCIAGSSSDLDGHTLTTTFTWQDGTGVEVGSGGYLDVAALVGNGTLVEGETIGCVATPNDGLEDGVATTNTTVVNHRPAATPTLSTDVAATTNTTLTCTPNGSDGDGHGLSYSFEWINHWGAVFATDTGSTSTLNVAAHLGGNLDEGQTVTCRVTPNDGYEDGPAADVNGQVNNQPIVAPTLNNNPATTAGTLTCTPNGSDDDSDQLSYAYEWKDSSGTLFTSDTGDSSTIDISAWLGGPLTEGETVTCSVTAND